jgi:hypothetical protein
MNRRPQLTIVAPNASPEEAAAVIAALEQFMRATAPRLAAAPAPPSGWHLAARHEAVMRQPGAPPPWE